MTTQEAIEWGGKSQRKLAILLGISQGAIAQWGSEPPAARQLLINKLSKGKLKISDSAYKRKYTRKAQSIAA